MTSDSDFVEDLRRLCTTFEHIEKLILLAASLNLKFLQSPHLGEAIFSDCYNYYLPNMGTGSGQGDINTKKVSFHLADFVSKCLCIFVKFQSWSQNWYGFSILFLVSQSLSSMSVCLFDQNWKGCTLTLSFSLLIILSPCLSMIGIWQKATSKFTWQKRNLRHVHSTNCKPIVEESFEHGKSA